MAVLSNLGMHDYLHALQDPREQYKLQYVQAKGENY